MKYLHLIWAALFRRKTRTILTLVSIIVILTVLQFLPALVLGPIADHLQLMSL